MKSTAKSLLLLLYTLWVATETAHAQTGSVVHGHVLGPKGSPVEFAAVVLDGGPLSTYADEYGHFHFPEVAPGPHQLQCEAVGYQPFSKQIVVEPGQELSVEVVMKTDLLHLDEVVVSATRSRMLRRDAPVIVGVVDQRTMEATQSLTLSEGLSYQPGVRVETNCQNCGFTQVRMNGLQGPYTQILINGRPSFSALVGVYGLEQIPTNMIERIEVVRGGGSALYGGNAIAGTINVITRDPTESSYRIGSSGNLIGGEALDGLMSVNASVVNESGQRGVTVFGFRRARQGYDANNDGYTEITELQNTTLGFQAFERLSSRSRLGLEVHHINEYRRGGNRLDFEPHQADIAEMLDHRITGIQLSFEAESKDERHAVALYSAPQFTHRNSYYGGGGNVDLSTATNASDSLVLLAERDQAARYYGKTDDLVWVNGALYTYSFSSLLGRRGSLTVGGEQAYNSVSDRMPGYNREIAQTVNTWAGYAQLQVRPLERLTILTGLRVDRVGIDGSYQFAGSEEGRIDRVLTVVNPRLQLMWDLSNSWRLRTGYARGFRAPQAFNEDLHLATVGGEAQVIRLSNDLAPETSHSLTASLTWTGNLGQTQGLVTLDGFWTRLLDPFLNETVPNQPSNNFLLLEKRNGSGATVAGANLEVNLAFSKKWRVQVGGTYQLADYDQAETIFETGDPDSTVSTVRILRTPNAYGYSTTTYSPTERWDLSLSGLFTGSMRVPEVVDPSTQFVRLRETPSFLEVHVKLAHTIPLDEKGGSKLQLYGGVQNLLESYQEDFQTGANRDANYIYGPARPRTFFLGLTLGGGF